MIPVADNYLQLVRSIARKVIKSTGARNETFDDLVGYGVIGLLEAMGRHEPELGEFATFAYMRIRGAMYDGLRLASPMSRAAHASGEFSLVPFVLEDEDLPDPAEGPDTAAHRADVVRKVQRVLCTLPAEEWHLYWRRYHDEHTFSEIGEETGIGKSHPSRRHRALAAKLRPQLAALV